MFFRDLLPENLSRFYERFEDNLSVPQYNHFQSWVSGILSGLVDATKISKQLSDKHSSSLTRFMSSEAWDGDNLNIQRINWASSVISQQYMKYYPLIIDDTINEKYGKLLAGVGKFFDHGKKRFIWGQQLLTSHLVVAQADLPLFVDLYLKEEQAEAKGIPFRSKIEIAIDHISKFPKLQGREGVVVTDSWYSSVKIINHTLDLNFRGIFDLKSDRKVTYMKKSKSVSEFAAEQDPATFKLVKVDGRLFRVWTAKVKVPRVHQDQSRLVIVQQELKSKTKERKWSKFKYILATHTSMGPWLIIFLYRRRWQIESFYRFVKNCMHFGGSRLESEESILKYFILVYFAYTYLILTRDPLSHYFEESENIYQALEDLNSKNFEEVIEWIYDKSIEGIDLEDIKQNLGLRKKTA
jgi:hypothetical protein